jgi:hypothetical protein
MKDPPQSFCVVGLHLDSDLARSFPGNRKSRGKVAICVRNPHRAGPRPCREPLRISRESLEERERHPAFRTPPQRLVTCLVSTLSRVACGHRVVRRVAPAKRASTAASGRNVPREGCEKAGISVAGGSRGTTAFRRPAQLPLAFPQEVRDAPLGAFFFD